MEGIAQLIRNLGPAKLGAIAGITVLLLGFFIFLTARLGAPNMELLYANLEPQDSAKITGRLNAQGVEYELRENGKQILVPSAKVGQVRLQMAEEGLSGSVVGYEIFDREETLGTSSFLQEVNRTRALEGELSRTISSIKSVQAARVHLVMPQRELFSRDVQPPSASVVLKMRGSQRLSRSQVLAIQHLIATAVPRLTPSNISIVDDRGTLLHKGGGEADQPASDALDKRNQYEKRVQQNVQELLERTLGFGKVRVEVRAVMDFTRTVVNQETYDPEGQVLRSSETIQESSKLNEGGEDTVSVGNNLPDAGLTEAGSGSQEETSRLEERSNFEISKTKRNTVKAAGEVDKLSVAVLVDGTYDRSQPTEENEDGELQYQPRTAEELQQIETLVKSAIGYEETRGDVVEIVNMRFAEPPLTKSDETQTYFGLTASDIKWLAQTLILGMLAILVILLVVRPLIGKLLEATPEALATATGDEPTMITDQSEESAAAAAQVPAKTEEEGEVESMIDIAQIEGKVKASTMRKIGDIIEKHPEEAVAILRNWMYQDST